MIDTHAHIYASEFDNDREQVVQRALAQGIDRILLPNIDLDSIEPMLATERQFPEVCRSMMGLHPCYVDGNIEETLKTIRAWFDKHNFIAVGEIGIDLYWDKTYKAEQEYAFVTQLQWAKELDLPVVIHTRDSIASSRTLLRFWYGAARPTSGSGNSMKAPSASTAGVVAHPVSKYAPKIRPNALEVAFIRIFYPPDLLPERSPDSPLPQ